MQSRFILYCVLKPCPWSKASLQEAKWLLNFIWSANDYIDCGIEIIDYFVAIVRTCFCMQATEQVAMPLTYVIRRKHVMHKLYICF
jgi:hypothetical protein